MEVLRYADLVVLPWKNGGGVTREIASARQGDFTLWRISRADVVQDGAFSDFAGLARILTVVSDTGMNLEHEDGVLKAHPWMPVQFGGELKIFARLDAGPITDLNLMFDPDHCTGDVVTRHGPTSKRITIGDQSIVAFHCLAGAPKISATTMNVGDTVLIKNLGANLRLMAGDAVLEISLKYHCQIDDIKLVIASR